MKLRAQLVVVSLFALCLPWAGCSFIYEMETILRTGQQDALAAVAGSVASLIDLPAANPGATGGDRAAAVYFFTGASIPNVDGYPDEAEGPDARMTAYSEAHRTEAPLRAEFLGIVDAVEAYVFIRVEDAVIRYHNPADGSVASGDHVVVSMGPVGNTRRYWLAPEAPGEFLARHRSGGATVAEPRVRGVWRDHADGYQIELRFPVGLLGDRFGFAAVDGDNPNRWAGSMAPRAAPGEVIRRNEALAAELETHARGNLRLSIVDADGWVRARAGRLQFQSSADTRLPPGGWILETLYRWIMVDDEDIASLSAETGARMERSEVAAALAGREAHAWYRVEDARGAAVASVAVPLRAGAAIPGVLVAEQSSSRILSLTNAAVIRLLFLTLVATFLITFGLVLYASLLSLRIRRLGRSVDAVLGDDGQIAGDFPTNWAGDEIGDLGRHFGHLLGRMREYNDYLKSLASKLSHELRTPLAVVSSSLDNMDHEGVPGSGQDYVRRARDGVARLSRILTAMSEASRVEQSIRSADIEPLDLSALLINNVESFRSAFGRPIDCDTPDSPVMVDGSADLLAQMLDKLMDNAADFCPADGRIAFALRASGSRAVLTVDNDGPPLPEAMRGELFESMVSVRSGPSAEPHLGLGLTIVRLVAEFHGGTVHAENRPGGGGARFRIELPARRQSTRIR